MKKLLVTLLILTITPLVSAQNTSQELCTYLTEGFSEQQQIPSSIPYSNEKIRIETTTGELVGQAIIEEKQAKFQNCNATTNETYLVQVKDVNTIETILTADTPQQSYEEAKDAGSIVIEGKSAWSKTKLTALNLALTVYGWFS